MVHWKLICHKSTRLTFVLRPYVSALKSAEGQHFHLFFKHSLVANFCGNKQGQIKFLALLYISPGHFLRPSSWEGMKVSSLVHSLRCQESTDHSGRRRRRSYEASTFTPAADAHVPSSPGWPSRPPARVRVRSSPSSVSLYKQTHSRLLGNRALLSHPLPQPPPVCAQRETRASAQGAQENRPPILFHPCHCRRRIYVVHTTFPSTSTDTKFATAPSKKKKQIAFIDPHAAPLVKIRPTDVPPNQTHPWSQPDSGIAHPFRFFLCSLGSKWKEYFEIHIGH